MSSRNKTVTVFGLAVAVLATVSLGTEDNDQQAWLERYFQLGRQQAFELRQSQQTELKLLHEILKASRERFEYINNRKIVQASLTEEGVAHFSSPATREAAIKNIEAKIAVQEKLFEEKLVWIHPRLQLDQLKLGDIGTLIFAGATTKDSQITILRSMDGNIKLAQCETHYVLLRADLSPGESIVKGAVQFPVSDIGTVGVILIRQVDIDGVAHQVPLLARPSPNMLNQFIQDRLKSPTTIEPKPIQPLEMYHSSGASNRPSSSSKDVEKETAD